MKHTEKEMQIKALKVMTDLNPKYFKEEFLKKIVFKQKDEVARPRGKIIDTWIVVLEDPIFDTTDFLTISDETGEPLYIQSKHLVMEIMKDVDGKYVEKK